MAESAIGALAVRIGADSTELISEFKKAEKATERLEASVRIMTGTLLAGATALGALVKSAADMQDEFGKLAQKVGVSTEAISELAYAAKLNNVSVDQLGAGLRNLSRYMVENGQAGASVEDRLLRIADEFAAAKDGAAKTAVAMQYFGKSGADLIPLLNQGRAGIEQMREEARKLGLTVTDEAAKAAEQFNDNLTRLAAVATGAKLALGNDLIPALTTLSAEMLEGIKIAGGLWQAIWQLGTINPFRSTGGNIQSLTQDLDDLRAGREKLAKLPGYEAALAGIDRDIMVTENRIKFLKFMQREQALAGANDGNLDARDLKARQRPAKGDLAMPWKSGDMSDEKIAKQWAEDAEEWRKAEAEAAALSDKQRSAERDLARASSSLDLQDTDLGDANIAQLKLHLDERNQLLMDAYDREQKLAIEHGVMLIENDGLSHTSKLDALRLSLLTAEELEIEAHEKRLERLAEFSEAELEALGGINAVKEQMAQEHQERLRQIEARGITTRAQFEKASMGQQAKTIFGELAGITAGVSQHSRGLFEINKVAGIANATIAAYEGITKTMAAYPYPINIGMAAAHAAAAFAQISAIRSASFGGGGAAPSIAGSTPAAPVSPISSGDTGGGSRGGPRTTVVLNGDSFGRKQVLALIDELNEAGDDGSRITVLGG